MTMHVAFLTNNLFPPREGIGRHIFEVARRLPDRGINPLIVAPGGWSKEWTQAEVNGLRVLRYPYRKLPPVHHHLLKPVLTTLDR